MQPRTSTAIGWSIATRWAERILGLASISILARLLLPEDFGLVALATLTQAAVEVFFAFGLDWALIQHRDPTRRHYGTAWTIQVASGIGCAAILGVSAPLIGWYFDEPRAAPIIYLLCVGVLLRSIENPYMAELRRNMDFRSEMLVRTTAKAGGLIVATSVAFFSRSYWALPIGILTGTSLQTAMSYVVHRGRPTWTLAERRELLGFSVWILLGGILGFARGRLAQISVGRALGNASLGVFLLAQEIANLASTELAAPLNRVMYSRQSRAAGDSVALSSTYFSSINAIWLVALPATVGVAATAPELVDVVLGPRWALAVPVLQLLCVANIVGLLLANSGSIFLSVAKGRNSVIVSAVNVVALVCALSFLVPEFGLLGAAYAQIVAASASLPVGLFLLNRIIDFRIAALLLGLWRPAVGCAAMASAVMGVRAVVAGWGHESPVILATSVSVGVCTYVLVVAVCWLLAGRPNGSELAIMQLVSDRLRRKA